MPTAIKKVKSVEVAGQTKNGNDYWTVTWDDDKTDKLFDYQHEAICQEALAKELNVEIEKEKKGQYFNIKKLTLVQSKLVKEVEKEGGELFSTENKMTKEDWGNKDKATRKSIERQKALEIAEIWCEEVIKTGTPVKTEELIKVAQRFEKYLETGE